MRRIRACSLVLIGALLATLAGIQPSSAQTCLINIEGYRLSFDNVRWSMRIGAGQRCIGGFRIGGATLESVRLAVAPESGEVTLQGPGFTYKAKTGFQGEDSFTVVVSGMFRRIPGTSTIRVIVTVIELGKPT